MQVETAQLLSDAHWPWIYNDLQELNESLNLEMKKMRRLQSTSNIKDQDTDSKLS